jgi:hypothetical protein
VSSNFDAEHFKKLVLGGFDKNSPTCCVTGCGKDKTCNRSIKFNMMGQEIIVDGVPFCDDHDVNRPSESPRAVD